MIVERVQVVIEVRGEKFAAVANVEHDETKHGRRNAIRRLRDKLRRKVRFGEVKAGQTFFWPEDGEK